LQTFANYCLPLEEVQRWITEQTGPVLGNSSTSTTTSYSTQHGSDGTDGRLTMFALADLDASSARANESPADEPSRYQAEQLLMDLEARALDWARQATAMRAQ